MFKLRTKPKNPEPCKSRKFVEYDLGTECKLDWALEQLSALAINRGLDMGGFHNSNITIRAGVDYGYYDDCSSPELFIVYSYLESDEAYKKKLEEYNKKLKNWNKWAKENKKEIAAEKKRRKEIADKKKIIAAQEKITKLAEEQLRLQKQLDKVKGK